MKFKQRELICLGNPYDINSSSGTPHYVLRYGTNIGLISKGIIFENPKNKIPKYLWNLKQFLKTGKYGGYQYTKKAIKKIEANIINNDSKLEPQYLLSLHPSIPIYPWSKNLFVDLKRLSYVLL